ncbi:glutathione peroxidase [Aquabacterium sp. OR-4]|uniref:glutathione peroxidase n=1 Tax=Aquabacterium sp. OR-4 TaxID=2978127 RepID=UPI0028C5E3CF|nr:glutathione peroxidase [Aquabacterium sp. OR-4]MDT7834048.1 glutathione peroxidase [Aquabacterium sp. OR-4]
MARLNVLIAGLLLAGSAASSSAAPAACPALLQHKLPRLQDEKPVDLCTWSGKVVLVVNTASYCGFTSQYKSLEALSDRYRARGLVVLGFPSNDFGAQEPGSNGDIAAFCENTFGVRFPMFAKSVVSGRGGAAPNALYAQLAQRTGQAPKWNFHKYLIGRDGTQVSSHASAVEPNDPKFIQEIEKLLKTD